MSPRNHHLDRRAADLIAQAVGNFDDPLTTEQCAQWLNVSTQWLEIGRHKGYGPPFKRLSPKMVRYLRGDVIKWLKGRTYTSTADYPRRRRPRQTSAEARS